MSKEYKNYKAIAAHTVHKICKRMTNLDEYITVSASMWLGTSSFRKKKQTTQQKESASV